MSLPFLEMLDMPNFFCLKNDPISHNSSCMVMPAKLLSEMPKFNGNPKEDPSMHIMKSFFGGYPVPYWMIV
jgi:hypothetical protein